VCVSIGLPWCVIQPAAPMQFQGHRTVGNLGYHADVVESLLVDF